MPSSYSSIIDNRDDNTLLRGLVQITPGGHELCIASAFFSLDALLMLSDSIGNYNKIRLLFGDDADVTQRRKLLERLKTDSDADLLVQRETGQALLSESEWHPPDPPHKAGRFRGPSGIHIHLFRTTSRWSQLQRWYNFAHG